MQKIQKTTIWVRARKFLTWSLNQKQKAALKLPMRTKKIAQKRGLMKVIAMSVDKPT